MRHYFDWAATAIPDERPPQTLPFANPSSQHTEGRQARRSLEESRKTLAQVLAVPPETLYFTSGGSESNALVLHSLALRVFAGKGKAAILASRVEHPSVLENCRLLERLGLPLTLINVEQTGEVSGRTLEAAIKSAEKAASPPRLAALMMVNNETGSVTDIAALSALLRARYGEKIHIHSDMVQALGKVPLNLAASGVDSAAFAAHKIGGPRGVGLLYLRKPAASFEAFTRGGGQEGGVRPGTENIAGAAAFAASVLAHASPAAFPLSYKAAAARMERLHSGLTSFERCTLIPAARAQDCENDGGRESADGRGSPQFSPFITQAAFRGIPGEVMARALDEAGFAVSTGSACHSAREGRPILQAMGVDERTAIEGIRISQGYSTTEEDIDSLLQTIAAILRRL